MFLKIIIAGIAIVLAFVLLPPLKNILGVLYDAMNATGSLTEFESLIWQAMPWIILIALFVGVIWYFKTRGEENE